MASFSRLDERGRRGFEGPDFAFLQNGHVHLVIGEERLAAQVNELVGLGYEVKTVDMTHRDLLAHLGQVFEFLSYYGGQVWDGLNDCICVDYVVPETATGVVVVFRDAHKADHERVALACEVFDRACRRHMLYGERMVVLVHSNDPFMELVREEGYRFKRVHRTK